MLKRLSPIVLILSIGLMSWVTQADDGLKTTTNHVVNPTESKLAIEVNKGKLIRLSRPATAVFIANPEIADIQVKSPNVVYIFGKTQGETSFYALDKDDNTIYSSEISVERNLTSLRKNLLTMFPDAQITATNIGDMIVLQGKVDGPNDSATAEQMAAALAGTKSVMNRLSIMQPTQVNLRVRIAEVQRSTLKQIGVDWSGIFSGTNASFGIASASAGINTAGATSFLGNLSFSDLDLNILIDALDVEGFLNVLAEPNLTAQSGETANFLAGGEFPVPVPGRDGISIIFKEFGVGLDFTPTVLDSGRISMHVAPEVSSLSDAGAIRINGISVPSISTRKISTTVELGSGQSFAIAGLLQNETLRDADKIPGLGDIPILGALFRSNKFKNSETELLVVVTPYLVRPVNDNQLTLPTDGFIAPSDMDQYMNQKSWKTVPNKKSVKTEPAKGPSLKKRAGFKVN